MFLIQALIVSERNSSQRQIQGQNFRLFLSKLRLETFHIWNSFRRSCLNATRLSGIQFHAFDSDFIINSVLQNDATEIIKLVHRIQNGLECFHINAPLSLFLIHQRDSVTKKKTCQHFTRHFTPRIEASEYIFMKQNSGKQFLLTLTHWLIDEN